VKHMQHPDKHTCNVRLKKMKYWEQKLATYVYNYCNICNISIYFCNIHMKHLQHTFETSETLEKDACNICFQAQHLLVPWTKMEAYRRGALCRRGARCYGVAWRSPVWSSSTDLGRGRGRRMECGRNMSSNYI
jgi:hypothetical protein